VGQGEEGLDGRLFGPGPRRLEEGEGLLPKEAHPGRGEVGKGGKRGLLQGLPQVGPGGGLLSLEKAKVGHEEAGVEPRASPRASPQAQRLHLAEEVGEGRLLRREKAEPGPLQEGEGGEPPGMG